MATIAVSKIGRRRFKIMSRALRVQNLFNLFKKRRGENHSKISRIRASTRISRWQPGAGRDFESDDSLVAVMAVDANGRIANS